jgi:hypothetical protein
VCHDDPPPAEVVADVIARTLDTNPNVRNWACFTLGTQWASADSPDLRDALMTRLDDIDRDTRNEALFGLAGRCDARVLPYVRAALLRPGGQLSRMELLAAGALADPTLHALVLRHQDGWDDPRMQRTCAAVRRLCDPAGPGEDLIAGVADLYRRRAHGRPDGNALRWWQLMDEMIDLAGFRAPGFATAVADRLAGDAVALDQLHHNSGLGEYLSANRDDQQQGERTPT